MLKRIYIDNFKSLVEFSLPAAGETEMDKVVCIVGLNGAGKSTLLQAFDFLATLLSGGMTEWLKSREWKKTDLLNKRSRKTLIAFRVEIDNSLGEMVWSGSYNASLMRCTTETLEMTSNSGVTSGNKVLIRVESNAFVVNGERFPIAFEYEGSVFSQLRSSALGSDASFAIMLLRHSFSGIKSLELLSPNLMRRPSRDAVDVGVGGEHLASFIHGFSAEGKSRLNKALQTFYPALTSISSKASKYGWKRLFITEEYGGSLETEARHVNDGLLRLLTVVAQTVAEPGVYKTLRSQKLTDSEKKSLGSLEHRWYQSILLDEVENGINPELMEALVKYLMSVEQQIIFTTHSPLLLNYLGDEEARRSVFYLYKDARGNTRCRRLFSIASMNEKLAFMGAGEAFADTELRRLDRTIASAMDGGEEE